MDNEGLLISHYGDGVVMYKPVQFIVLGISGG